jgi:hypothetical protein
MELRPIFENPSEVMVRFDSGLEDELFNPHRFQLAARKVLERMHFMSPREYPYTHVFSEEALYSRESEVHARNCGTANNFPPAVQGVRQQLHTRTLEFGRMLRAVSQATWQPYER